MYVNEMDVRLLLHQVGDLIRSEPDLDHRRVLLATLRTTSDTIVDEISVSLGEARKARAVLAPEERLARQQARASAMRTKRNLPDLSNAVKIELRWMHRGGGGTRFWRTYEQTGDIATAEAAAKEWRARFGPAGREASPDRPEDRPP